MQSYKFIIEYDGSRYKGWQRLGNNELTIQAEMEDVLSKLERRDIEIVGCSRTDCGVHSLGQVATAQLHKHYHCQELRDYLNQHLPEDIIIRSVETVQDTFHPRHDSTGKTYRYQIWNKEHQNPFLRKYSNHIKEALNLDAMRKAANHFLGSHDFTSYSNAKGQKNSMVRTIYAISIFESEGLVSIEITGDGFLYNMVRKMVGALIEVGLGKRLDTTIEKTLEHKDREQVLYLAPSKGLILVKIYYLGDNFRMVR